MISKELAFDITADLDRKPVAKLVQEASRYDSSIYFEYQDKRVNAKSIMGMMTFLSIMSKAAKENGLINIIVNGADEETAMQNLENYLCS